MKKQENFQETKEEFSLDSFLKKDVSVKRKLNEPRNVSFKEICKFVKDAYHNEGKNRPAYDNVTLNVGDGLDKSERFASNNCTAINEITGRERDALIGREYAVKFYLEHIKEIIIENNLENGKWPKHYKNLEQAVFAENWGFAGMNPWIFEDNEKYKSSTSAKIIDARIYCMVGNKLKLQSQKISKENRERIIKTLLWNFEDLENSEKNIKKKLDVHKIEIGNGIDIVIFPSSINDRVQGQDMMVFKKVSNRALSFSELANLNVIPTEGIAFFESIIEKGENVIFSGSIGSGKSTFLRSWQRCEENDWSGVSLSTSKATPWHKISPKAPIMEIIADKDELEAISKILLKDCNVDYVIAENLNEIEVFKFILELLCAGMKRSKITIHDNNPSKLPYTLARKLHLEYGGDFDEIVEQIFLSFDYIFEFCRKTEKNTNSKERNILNKIYKTYYNDEKKAWELALICEFDREENIWRWNTQEKDNKITLKIMQEKDKEKDNKIKSCNLE